MVSGAFCIWQLLALTGTAKQNEVMVLFMVSDRSSAKANGQADRYMGQKRIKSGCGDSCGTQNNAGGGQIQLTQVTKTLPVMPTEVADRSAPRNK